jgi:signal transduction histidine kinase
VNKIIDNTLPLLEVQTKYKDIKIIKQLRPNLPNVMGDFIQLQEVFFNIMLNAVQAMSNKGGELSIRTFATDVTKFGKRKTDIFKLGSKAVVIEFEDTGEGISEEKLGKIFDPFFSTKESGTGLGLSICHGIIEAHQGTIEAHSAVGKGTTFIIQLPAQKEERSAKWLNY